MKRKFRSKKKDIRDLAVDCETCGQQHRVKLDYSKLTKEHLERREPVLSNFMCPDVARMYRVMSYAVDTRANILNNEAMAPVREGLEQQLRQEWGPLNFEPKLERFKNLNLVLIGLPEEYYDLLIPVTYSYCCGYYYPAMTSAGSLGERILNRLIIKTRDYFKSSEHYKKIWNKQSFDQWDAPVQILEEWGIITSEVAHLFLKLKQFRNDSTHYNDGYDFESNSHEAVKTLTEIIDCQFNYTTRKDLFWVFDVPGEIWVKSEVNEDPFVKELVLPHCLHLTAYCEPSARPPIKGKNAPLKPLSDRDFIKARIDKKKPLTENCLPLGVNPNI